MLNTAGHRGLAFRREMRAGDRKLLGDEIATHSSVLTWRIPGSAEPGGLPSMGSHKVGHD